MADEHTLARAGLRRLLESLPGAEVVAEADDGDQIANLVALHRPDVVVIDLIMSRVSGYDVLGHLKRDHPEVRVIVISMHADAEHVVQAQAQTQRGPKLSPRQSEILQLLGEGFATKEIAAHLQLSVKTVETHRARLMRSLHFRRSNELLRYAVLSTVRVA
ncbi:MAG TPA: response regulator transcription factor [Verrucomicrobiae bacterium]|nr:response regulator transcription factor [Verrucomicrobiae bacterium]